jgi:hypothetical protein
MASVEQTCRTYQELATLYAQQGQAQLRDRFLVLAADALHTAGRTEEAERMRGRLLQANPHHLLKPFASLDEAMKTTDVKNYVTGLRRTYPPEKAVELLESLRSGGEDKPAEPPPTAPLSTIRPERAPPQAAVDALKVYRFQDEIDPEASLPRTRPEPMNRPAPREAERPAPAARPVRAARPTQPARPIQTAGAAPAWQPARPTGSLNRPYPETDSAEPAAGAWVATVLFWMLLLASLALAGFTLAGPFLPRI